MCRQPTLEFAGGNAFPELIGKPEIAPAHLCRTVPHDGPADGQRLPLVGRQRRPSEILVDRNRRGKALGAVLLL